jgi:hypothetical protein
LRINKNLKEILCGIVSQGLRMRLTEAFAIIRKIVDTEVLH